MIVLDISPANDVFLDIRKVWEIVYILSMLKTDSSSQNLIKHRYRSAKCAHCYMPILEHTYDSYNSIVLHWVGNCAIVKKKRTG
jgi:hypothetical protein